MIDDYLEQLRRRGIRDPRTLAEVRAHLEDAARELGETEAIARFGSPDAVARSLRRFPKLPLLAAVAIGLAVGYVDSRPGFDATGMTVVSLFGVSFALSVWSPRYAWLWALLIGGFVPLFEGPGAPLVALAFAGAGALAGVGSRRLAAA